MAQTDAKRARDRARYRRDTRKRWDNTKRWVAAFKARDPDGYHIYERDKARRYRKLTKERLAGGRAKPALCDVCHKIGTDGKIALDHDHETGVFRGWLCTYCNVALGMAKDDPVRLRALADYLEVPREKPLRLVKNRTP